MKRITLLLISIAVFIVSAGSAGAAGELVKINSIDSVIVIKEDGNVLVTEKISADFSASPGHGIYRDIPFAYRNKDGTILYTEIKVSGVEDENGTPYQYSISGNDSNLRIKIGNPEVLVYGQKIYVVTYSVAGILTSFENYDELYWNAVGTGWTSPIDSASAVVILPEDGIIQSACYIGVSGSNTSCESENVSGNKASFSATGLGLNEAFTVAVGFRKGMVPLLLVSAPPSVIETYFTQKNIIIFFTTVLAGISGILILWWRRGRDFWWKRKSLFDPEVKEEIMPLGGHETIVPEYGPPEGLRPAEVGVLKDETADTLDISATIVDLAIRGYIKIIEIPKIWMFGATDYELKKLKEADDKMMMYEQELFKSLFETDSILLSELKNKFYKKLGGIKDLLYEEVVNKKLFTSNPKSTRNKHIISGVLGVVVSFFILSATLSAFGLGLMVVSVIYLIFGSVGMVRRTAYGRELYRKVRGYELFLSNTEKYRQPFFENENTFMDVLPYAMVFGVTKKLAKAMEDMGIQPQQPVWFAGHGAFNIGAFGSSMDSLSKSLSTAIASAPGGSGSGGGGGAGGGGGGGGGGGW